MIPKRLHQQPDIVQRAFFVTGTSVAFSVTSLLVTIGFLFEPTLSYIAPTAILPFVLGVLILAFMRITGLVHVAANILAFSVLGLQFYTCFSLYGLYSSSIFSLILLPVVVALLGGLRSGLIAGATTIGGLIFLYSLHMSGHQFPGPQLPEKAMALKQLISGIVYVVLGTVIGLMYEVTRNSAMQKVGAENKDLNKRIISAVKNYEERNAYLLENIMMLLEEMDAISKGNFATKLEAKNDDEIGMLVKSFNDTIASIRAIVSELAAGTQSAAFSFYRINTAIEDIVRSSQKQSDRVKLIYHTIEQMQQSLTENIDHAKASSVRAAQNADMARQASSSIERSAHNMQEMVKVVQAASETVVRLGESSKKIGSVIGVINEIAGQTNLLALNAAIEAARAGEQGRGFSVVADEVRKLAERTTKATKEVTDVIHKIQADVERATNAINSGNTQVGEGMNLSKHASEVFDNVMQESNETQRMMEQVVRNAEIQLQQRNNLLQAAKGTLNETHNTRQTVTTLEEFANDFGMLVYYLRSLADRYTSNDDAYAQVGLSMSGKNYGSLQLLDANKVVADLQKATLLIEDSLRYSKVRQDIGLTNKSDTLGQWIQTEGEKNLFEDSTFQALATKHRDLYRVLELFTSNMNEGLHDDALQNAKEHHTLRQSVEQELRTLMAKA